jgi:hypothetical protein
MIKDFVADFHEFVAARGLELVHFAKGQRKDDLAQRFLAGFTDGEGVLFVGRAQEKAGVWRAVWSQFGPSGSARPCHATHARAPHPPGNSASAHLLGSAAGRRGMIDMIDVSVHDGHMAKRLDAFDTSSTQPRRYPWTQWADGSTWEIRQGEDYDVSTENMRVGLHMRARQMSSKVRTRKFTDALSEGLIFQFVIPRESAMDIPESEHSGGDGSAIEALYADACQIYERARREVTIERSDGTRQKYAAIRFKQQIDRAQAQGQLVAAVVGIVDRRTRGFGHLEDARRPDLMLETFVIDETRPYHNLLPDRTVRIARDRMAEYYRRHLGDDHSEGSSS